MNTFYEIHRQHGSNSERTCIIAASSACNALESAIESGELGIELGEKYTFWVVSQNTGLAVKFETAVM